MPRLSEIFGQNSAIQTLTRAYDSDRLPHGLIFAGPVGAGKATTAAALAQLFLCEKPKGHEPCGKCDSCHAMAANSHPDFHVITRQLIRYHDKTGKSKGIDLSIEVIRHELVAPAGLKSALGRGKVFIVEEAESMTTQAQNAMLKTLEEPASRTLIILLTDQPGALLSTIRSRCQLVPFAPLHELIVRKQLEERGIAKIDATSAAALSEGSLGNALQWLADGVVPRAQHLHKEIDNLLKGAPADGLDAWFKEAAEAYAAKQIERDELASKDQATRAGYALYLHLAGSHLRKLMQIQHDPDLLDRICSAIDAIRRAEQYLWANVSTPLIFQQLTLNWESDLCPATRH